MGKMGYDVRKVGMRRLCRSIGFEDNLCSHSNQDSPWMTAAVYNFAWGTKNPIHMQIHPFYVTILLPYSTM